MNQRLLLAFLIFTPFAVFLLAPLWLTPQSFKLCDVHIGDTRDIVREKCGDTHDKRSITLSGREYDAWWYWSGGTRYMPNNRGMRIYAFGDDGRVTTIFRQGAFVQEGAK